MSGPDIDAGGPRGRDDDAPEGAPRRRDAEALTDALDAALYAEFRAGGEEHAATAEAALLALERRPDDRAAIDDAFRAIHSVKGDAGCLGLQAIAHVAHSAESALSLAREGTLTVAGPLADALLRANDHLRRAIAASGDAPAHGISPEAFDVAHDLEAAAAAASRDAAPPSRHAPAQLTRITDPTPPPAGAPEGAADAELLDSSLPTVRVDLARLDALLDLVGELVICHSQAVEHPAMRRTQEDALGRDLSRLEKLVLDVQRTSLSLRMVPVRALFRKMNRVTRDTARRSGKQVDLVTRGEATELDRGVLAELADPLVHLVRNAIDHGIEPPAARRRAGKPEAARLTLEAYARGGFVHVEVADDGRGIDVEKVRRRAIERGLLRPEENLDHDRTIALIFAPGFTTSDGVTELSGRGVGLDVVRARVERLHGHVTVTTRPGAGAVFALRLPLTLSVLEGMVVGAGRERCVVPTSSIVETVRFDPRDVGTVLGRGETVRYRGAALPLVRLERAIGAAPPAVPPARPLVVVIEALGRRAGLLVDEVAGHRQVVVKPLGERLRALPGVLGGTVLGDGRVGLILDVDGIVPGGAGERAAAPAA